MGTIFCDKSPTAKALELIPIPEGGYTVEYLKSVITTAKLYIRPIQCNISLDPVKKDVSVHVLGLIHPSCLLKR